MTSWKEDLGRTREMLLDQGDLETFRASREQRIAKLPHWGALNSLPYETMPILLALGAEVLRTELAPISHIVEPALRDYLRRQDDGHEISSAFIDFADTVNVFECVGSVTGLLTTLQPYLVRVTTSRDSEYVFPRWNLALAALALDDARTWKPIAGLLPEQTATFVPGATFEFNLQGLIAHLGGALAQRAGVDGVVPAWRDFLRCAPILRETSQADENTCLWVARVVHHQVGGNPLASVGEFLHREVQKLAASE